MKKFIKNKIWIAVLLLSAACVNPDDLVTEDAKEGGGILSVVGSEGKLLGIEDPETHIVEFTDTDMTIKVSEVNGFFHNETFTLVKQFNGQEVVVEEFSELPYEYSITTVEEFLEGFTGVEEEDLRIGDVIAYKVKINTSDAGAVYSDPAQVPVTVNCGSDLAGTYIVTGLLQRPASGIVDQPIGPRTETVTKEGVNFYGTQNTAHWTNAALGYEPCPVLFSVTCGKIAIAEQNLCDAYSNLVSGAGYVDEETGDIYLEYQVTGGNLRTVTLKYEKQ